MKKLLVVLILLIAFGCKKENFDAPVGGDEPELKYWLLKRVAINDIQTRYYYDDERIINITETSPEGIITHEINIEYLADTTIREAYADGELVQIEKFYQNSEGLLISKLFMGPQLSSLYIEEYYDNGKSCGIDSSKIKTPSGSVVSQSYFEYAAENCSLVESEYSSNNQLNYYTEVDFDDKKSAYTSIDIKNLYNARELRNKTQVLEFNENDEVLENISYTSIFEYNEHGFPVEEIRTSFSGVVTIYTYYYY